MFRADMFCRTSKIGTLDVGSMDSYAVSTYQSAVVLGRVLNLLDFKQTIIIYGYNAQSWWLRSAYLNPKYGHDCTHDVERSDILYAFDNRLNAVVLGYE